MKTTRKKVGLLTTVTEKYGFRNTWKNDDIIFVYVNNKKYCIAEESNLEERKYKTSTIF